MGWEQVGATLLGLAGVTTHLVQDYEDGQTPRATKLEALQGHYDQFQVPGMLAPSCGHSWMPMHCRSRDTSKHLQRVEGGFRAYSGKSLPGWSVVLVSVPVPQRVRAHSTPLMRCCSTPMYGPMLSWASTRITGAEQ
jgi:hypothetical protein